MGGRDPGERECGMRRFVIWKGSVLQQNGGKLYKNNGTVCKPLFVLLFCFVFLPFSRIYIYSPV